MNDDAKLIEACRQNLEKGFELIYSKYVGRLKGVAYRYVSDEMKAEDILHDAFVKVYTKLNMYKQSGSLEAWLRRIVVNTAIDFYKKEKRTQSQLDDFNYSEWEDEENTLDDDYTLEELNYAIEKLPAGYKLVFNLYAIDNFSHKEIAETLSISEGTSKSQLHKAREFLKRELKQIKKVQQ
jgi:RNA polymerase sigma factor (sigma-70 family)